MVETTVTEIKEEAEEFIDELKRTLRARGLPCKGWDEGGEIRKVLVEDATEMIKHRKLWR